MMDDKDKCRNVKNKMFFNLITRENVIKKHKSILKSFRLLPLSIYLH